MIHAYVYYLNSSLIVRGCMEAKSCILLVYCAAECNWELVCSLVLYIQTVHFRWGSHKSCHVGKNLGKSPLKKKKIWNYVLSSIWISQHWNLIQINLPKQKCSWKRKKHCLVLISLQDSRRMMYRLFLIDKGEGKGKKFHTLPSLISSRPLYTRACISVEKGSYTTFMSKTTLHSGLPTLLPRILYGHQRETNPLDYTDKKDSL